VITKDAVSRRPLEFALPVMGVAALGFNLRGAITSLPPVFPELQSSLQLSGAELSVLAAVPTIVFAVVSGFAAWMARRLGEERVLFIAIVALAVGLVLRGVAASALLFPGTILAAAAIAVMNVLLSSLIKRRWPERAGFFVGLYITALSAGAIVGSLVSVPLWNATGGSVPLTLGWLALPALIAAVAWLPQTARQSREPKAAPPQQLRSEQRGTISPRAKGRADVRTEERSARNERGATTGGHRVRAAGGEREGTSGKARRTGLMRSALAWQVTIFMGTQSLLYYATLSWLPSILRDRGESAVTAGDMLALMGVGNVAVALIVPVLAQRMRSQQVLIVPTVIALAAGLAGAMYAPLGSAAVWVLILGAGQNAALSLAIYFTMARAPHPAAAASLSALAQAAGYLLASAGPLEVGLLHSATGSWTLPVNVLLAINVVLLIAGVLAARDRVLPDDGAPEGAARGDGFPGSGGRDAGAGTDAMGRSAG
jgi:CP family cyanate transporter-like MFS transporter